MKNVTLGRILKTAATFLCLSFLHLTAVQAGGPVACAQVHHVKPVASEITVPKYAAEFNEGFGEQIKLSLNFPGLNFRKKDQSQTREKITTLVKFGFPVKNGWFFSLKKPTWLEVSQNYRKLLDEKKVPEADRLYPAIVLYKDVGGRREYKLADPFRESLPKAEDGYSVLETTIEFNIPFKVIAKGIQEGKFPMMANHDIYHFVSFSIHPWFSKVVKQSLITVLNKKMSPAFKRRFYWVLEFFSVPNGHLAATSLMKKFNLNPEKKSYLELRADLQKMDDLQVLEYATDLGQVLDKSLLDVSSATANAAEFSAMAKRFFQSDGMTPHTVGPLNSTRLSSVTKAVDIYRRNGDVPQNALNATAREIAFFNFKTISYVMRTIDTALKTLSDQDLFRMLTIEDKASYLLNESPTGEPLGLATNAREILTDHLRDLAAMTEFTLLSIRSERDAERLVQNLLKPDVSYDEPAGKFMNEIFKNDLIKSYYFDGLKRPEN